MHRQTLSVAENASFVMDIDAIDFHDLKADDLGSIRAQQEQRNLSFHNIWNSMCEGETTSFWLLYMHWCDATILILCMSISQADCGHQRLAVVLPGVCVIMKAVMGKQLHR